MYFDVIDHAKLLAFFEVVYGGSWFAKKGDFAQVGVPVRIERPHGSIGPEGHIKHLDLAMRAMPGVK